MSSRRIILDGANAIGGDYYEYREFGYLIGLYMVSETLIIVIMRADKSNDPGHELEHNFSVAFAPTRIPNFLSHLCSDGL
jgi:hypothetical protein